MNDVPVEVPAPPRWRWLALVGLICGAALVALVLLQVQQLERLGSAMRSGSELRVVEMHRQETEYLQLRAQWLSALDTGSALDLRALALRYEIWVGRVSMLKPDTATRRTALLALPRLDDALLQVDAFVAATDVVLAADLGPDVRRARLADLLPQLVALGEPMHDLALAAAHQSTVDQTERNLVIARHTRSSLALTALLALLVLAFAGLSAHQMRQLVRRHRSLQALATQVHEARQVADAANQAKSQFLANMSHEIRTPLQGLLGMLSVLRETTLDAQQQACLRTATGSADHLVEVLDDILDLSQLEQGALQITPAPVAVRELVAEVEAVMQPQLQQQQLSWQVRIDAGVPELVELDATRVRQVLYNLVSNATKYAGQGRVELELRRQPDEQGRDRLAFVVSDTGRGMDSATLARVFQRFERGPAHASGGTGLGLTISRGLARRMGGELLASSEPGQGSRFTLLLPLVALHERASPAAPAASASPPAHRLEVLVAEDNPVNREVLAALLDSMGHRGHIVPGGEEAIAELRRRRFDVVLMDLHMPGIDGIEATRRIRALPDVGAATVPIVALTADAFTDTRQRCLVAGMNDFLSKPVNREKLGAVLRQLFGAAATVAAGAAAGSRVAAAATEALQVPLIDGQVVERAVQSITLERYRAMLAGYLGQAATTVERLRQAMRDAQPTELHAHAHSTRGAALNLGLTALAGTAHSLEQGAANLPAHEVARLVQCFDDQLTATRNAASAAGLLPVASLTR